jgi:aminopeptidase C
MKLPETLPTDREELEQLYQAYKLDNEDFDEDDFRRLMEARLQAWGVDPQNMSPDQLFGAMSESMNSMLMNLYAAREDAPDDEAVSQVDEIIHLAEQLRQHVTEAMKEALDKPPGEQA